jgi:dihydrofolate reductase
MIKIIVATSKNNVIGNNNSLIWNLPADLKRFKELTTHNNIVMGRKTYESIGRALPNRRNIIVTRDKDYNVDNCDVVNSIEEALLLCNNDCFIIGGGEIYKQTLPIADMIYLTEINSIFEGDTFFPTIDNDWVEVSRESFETEEGLGYSFINYERFQF